MRLLVTRPEPDNARTAAALRARGHDVICAPLLAIEPVDPETGPGPFAGVALTSVNAARRLPAALSHLPVFAVGRRTAEAARDAGGRDVTSADGRLDDLVRLVSANVAKAGPSLLYLAGEDRAGDLAGALAAHGIAVLTVVAYRAVAATSFPADTAAALRHGAIEGVLHFSRRTAAAYAECARAAGIAADPIHFCLSRQVAEPLVGAKDIRIARDPDEGALLDLIG